MDELKKQEIKDKATSLVRMEKEKKTLNSRIKELKSELEELMGAEGMDEVDLPESDSLVAMIDKKAFVIKSRY